MKQRASYVLMRPASALRKARGASPLCQVTGELIFSCALMQISYTARIDSKLLCQFQNRWPGWPDNDAMIVDRDARIRVGGGGNCQTFDEVSSEISQSSHSGAELSVKCGPADYGIFLQCVESIRKPDIDIDDERTRTYSA